MIILHGTEVLPKLFAIPRNALYNELYDRRKAMEKNHCELSINDSEKIKKIITGLAGKHILIFEYFPCEDLMLIYNAELRLISRIEGYIQNLDKNPHVYPEDRWKMDRLCSGHSTGKTEVRFLNNKGSLLRKVITWDYICHKSTDRKFLIGTIRDITEERKREKILADQAKRDSLTGLYNRFFGKELINEYLHNKNPYASCGMMVIDIDYFKTVNDVFGHLFGDLVLQKLSQAFSPLFDKNDILMRAGGDEFVVFLKDISHGILVKKTSQLIDAVRELKISGHDYSMTCSVGVCFLPENVSGFTYDQLFENADWALYRAKENGKNRYEFCDNLQRFQLTSHKTSNTETSNIDARYLRNDIVSTAFEVFEKMNSFAAAMELLMEIIGARFRLDRITVIHTNIKEQNAGRQFQWTSPSAPPVLKVPGSFTKEDFLTLFQSYDEYGTTVLQHDNMSMYSPDAQSLLMQGQAKTVLYAAMYCEGQYTGAISYVVCDQKRFWTRQDRSQLGELTKIISAHLAKNQILNMIHKGIMASPEYDSLTGLLSFSKFKDETERFIVGGYATSHLMAYIDFDNFKYFNQKYGYEVGDQLLKEYSHYLVSVLENEQEVYFSRVVADQFVLFTPYKDLGRIREYFEQINDCFLIEQTGRFRGVSFFIRTGIYPIQPGDLSASEAIDAANYARCQITRDSGTTVAIYDSSMAAKKQQENEILNGMTSAMEKEEFQVYLQPRFSLKDFSVVGAEALVRWVHADGTILYPDSFIPLYEKNGRIIDLDLYMFEKVAAFQASLIRRNREPVPISVNVSVRHISNFDTVKRYDQILAKYQVDPSLVEIELTETGTVSDAEYNQLKSIFVQFRERKFRTAMDDFGSGYSMLNMLIDIPVDTVKLDRAFVHYCGSTKRGVSFLKQLVRMVKGLGYHLVCEGLETAEQVNILRDMGCEEGQGYWFAKPMPAEEFEKSYF